MRKILPFVLGIVLLLSLVAAPSILLDIWNGIASRFFFLFIIFLLAGLGLLFDKIKEIFAEKQNQKRLKQQQIEDEKEAANRRDQRFQTLYRVFQSDIYKLDLDAIPSEITFTDSLLPIYGFSCSDFPYGIYTVYASHTDPHYHLSSQCKKCELKIHLFHIPSHLSPCPNCAALYDVEIPDWYLQIIDLYKQKKKTTSTPL